jgi:hypothetical protein
MRFTNPIDILVTNPKARRALVARVAMEKPDALLLSGDIPFSGGNRNDYAVYREETRIWRDDHLRVFPALGNHEFHNCLDAAWLENWWQTFPEQRGRRWYAVQIGSQVMALNLDSNSDLTGNSEQGKWIKTQLDQLPSTIRYVFFNLHHPPVADIQPGLDSSHNPRANEIALAKFLEGSPQNQRVRMIVVAGHIHNYARFFSNGIVYLVSGGGAAKPREIVRGPEDLYKQNTYPNYHYVKFQLTQAGINAEMIRLEDPNSSASTWKVRDQFTVAPR